MKGTTDPLKLDNVHDQSVRLFYLREIPNFKSRWMMTQNEPEDRYCSKLEPDPPSQSLKLFSESFICLSEGDLSSQYSVDYNLSCFIAEWERKFTV